MPELTKSWIHATFCDIFATFSGEYCFFLSVLHGIEAVLPEQRDTDVIS
jgi:hypothetical protein